MKHFYAAAVLIFFSSSAFSQISKGQWMLGGNASFSRSVVKYNYPSGNSDSKTTSLQLLPGAGYFFINGLAAGLRVGIINSDIKQEIDSRNAPLSFYYSSKSKINACSVSPFIRYYFLPSSRKLNFFADAAYAYGKNKEKTNIYQQSTPAGGLPMVSTSTTNSEYKSHSCTIAAGPAFFINSKVAVELTAGYTFTKYKGAGQKANTFLLGAGFQIHLNK
jgi:hypothetical protein